MEYFGGMAYDAGGLCLAVVDCNDRLVTSLQLASTSELADIRESLRTLRAILVIENGHTTEAIDMLLRFGANVTPASDARMRMYRRLRMPTHRSDAHWLAHLCWLDPDICGHFCASNSLSIPERLAYRAETVPTWF